MLNVRGHVISTGYNGVAAGLPHCNETVKKRTGRDFVSADHYSELSYNAFPNACSGATSPSGTNLDGCEAIHAEQNALLQCKNVYEIDTVYVSASPCVTCTKLLMNTSARRVVFKEEYPHNQAKDMWIKSGRVWEKFE